MQEAKVLDRHIEALKADLMERYRSWVEVALADMKDNTELTQISVEGFQSGLDQLSNLSRQLGKLEQAYEGK